MIGKMVASEPGVQYAQLHVFYNDLEIFKDNTCMLKRSCGNYDTKIQTIFPIILAKSLILM
jgi:hypothetical protein